MEKKPFLWNVFCFVGESFLLVLGDLRLLNPSVRGLEGTLSRRAQNNTLTRHCAWLEKCFKFKQDLS